MFLCPTLAIVVSTRATKFQCSDFEVVYIFSVSMPRGGGISVRQIEIWEFPEPLVHANYDRSLSLGS